MSAFVVSHDHITAILTGFVAARPRWRRNPDRTDLTQLGQLLWDENVKSVGHRYDKAPDELTYRYPATFQKALPIVATLKLCDCLEYQSCEHDEWAGSIAKKELGKIYSTLISALPGYDDAAWSL